MNDVRLVDVHCHLESELYAGGLDTIIAGARKVGIARLITSSIVPGEWALSESIARRYEEVEFALGIHPWYGREGDEDRIDGLFQARERGAVARRDRAGQKTETGRSSCKSGSSVARSLLRARPVFP